MIDKCDNCGKPIGNKYYSGQCDGVVYMAPDPFRMEIYEDYSDYEDCDGNRHESARDV